MSLIGTSSILDGCPKKSFSSVHDLRKLFFGHRSRIDDVPIKLTQFCYSDTQQTAKLTCLLFSPLTDYLEEVSKGSDGEENINNILQSANFDPEFSSRWKPYRVELVHNKRLDEEYDGEYFYYRPQIPMRHDEVTTAARAISERAGSLN